MERSEIMDNVITLETPITHDAYTELAVRTFDVPRTDKSVSYVKNNIVLPTDPWNVGLIYGPSGSGKSTLLKTFGESHTPVWNNKAAISNFTDVTPDEASEILCAVGLSTIPAWLRSYNCLSNGEKFRADIARTIAANSKLALIDEFTSVVDRNVAKSASFAFQKYIRKNNKQVILASCHADIIEWLQPDWVYNPIEGIMHHLPRGLVQRPQIPLKIFRVKYEAWELFKHHHYLSADLNKASKCYMATWQDEPVALTAFLALPHPKIKGGWRESRTVVLPDYQGLGIGVRLSDYFGSLITAGGGRMFSRTCHPAMIAYRLNKKDKWKETTHSRHKRKPQEFGQMTEKKAWDLDQTRVCFAFEFIGTPCNNPEEANLFFEKTP
jgi:ABC-type lipoprotein export system ATPase subunit/GNAT superfamily N-acetyltransferase